jgi:hypothetical protein
MKRYNNYTMEFEFDPEKSRANKRKHGIDFEEARALWDDSDVIEIPARTTGEPRFMAVGTIGRRHWSAVFTWRGKKRRIISVCPSRREEVEIFES